MSTCKHEKHLVGYFHGELAGNEKKLVKDHLGKCRHCQMVLKDISRLDEASKKIPVPQLTDHEWEAVENRVYKRPVFRWRFALAGVSLAAAAAAMIIVIRFSGPKPEEVVSSLQPSAVVAQAEEHRVSPPSPLEGQGEGEYVTASTAPEQESSPSPLSPPIKGGEEFVADTPNDSPLGFQASTQHRERRGDLQRSPVHPSDVAQPTDRILEEPIFTPTPLTQKDKVVIKHNRINPSLGERMTVSVKSDTREAINIKIYSKSGKLVRTLVDKEVPMGIHEFYWDGTNDSGATLASGIYFIVIEAPGFELREKAVVLK